LRTNDFVASELRDFPDLIPPSNNVDHLELEDLSKLENWIT
jgi:hypothetical protein